MLRIAAIVSALLIAATTIIVAAPEDKGVLQGTLSIQRSGGTQLSEDNGSKRTSDYAAYPLVILSKETQREIAGVTPNEAGHYSVALPPGEYVLDLKNRGRIRAPRLPFTIRSGKTTKLDMTIEGPLNVMSAR